MANNGLNNLVLQLVFCLPPLTTYTTEIEKPDPNIGTRVSYKRVLKTYILLECRVCCHNNSLNNDNNSVIKALLQA